MTGLYPGLAWHFRFGRLVSLLACLYVPSGVQGQPEEPSAERPPAPQVEPIIVNSDMSLVHVGSSDSFAITPEGHGAAKSLYNALTHSDPEAARAAIKIYDTIIPRENYGGEYTALQWFARYLIAPEAERQAMLADPFVAQFFHFFGDNDFAVLKEYLKRKYRVAVIGDEETKTGQDRQALLEDTMLFNNPRREEWDKTSELLKLIKLKEGDRIADVGSGPGYFTFKFSKMVGETGKVYAIDIVAAHLDYVGRVQKVLGANNIELINNEGSSLGLKDKKVDALFMCSLYHNIYAMATKPERDEFVESIKNALTDDGILYVVDNGLVEPGQLPYHGPYVAKELLIGQFLYYGFELISQHSHIPQRYLLVFRKARPLPAGEQPADPLEQGPIPTAFPVDPPQASTTPDLLGGVANARSTP